MRKLIIASILCLFFMIGETVGGALAGSLAIMTDAAHLLTDFASFMISLLAIYLASLPPTKKMSFGWHRAEIIGALISVLLIWVVTGILVYMACLRVISKEYEINAQIMLITSSVGVLVNIIMAATLHQHSHSHASGTPSARQLRTNMNAVVMTEEGGSEDPLVTSSVQFASGEQDSTMREEHSHEEESKKREY
jgi:solute carrier family 30 (zinc transporter), member 2